MRFPLPSTVLVQPGYRIRVPGLTYDVPTSRDTDGHTHAIILFDRCSERWIPVLSGDETTCRSTAALMHHGPSSYDQPHVVGLHRPDGTVPVEIVTDYEGDDDAPLGLALGCPGDDGWTAEIPLTLFEEYLDARDAADRIVVEVALQAPRPPEPSPGEDVWLP